MITLSIATANQGKIEEFRKLFPEFEVFSLSNFPELGEIIEDGLSFEENAIKKASVLATHTGELALADDSGLEVDALNGEPGIYSARYSGTPHDFDKNIKKLLKNLENTPDVERTARFRCVIALINPKEKTDGSPRIVTVKGVVEGVILKDLRGKNGFGYDPVFYSPELGKTFAEADPNEKHSVSHRARAVQKIMPYLRDLASTRIARA
ncbi:MAG: hypothetical protein B6244_02705 [Candidatus Cloacimonetes bacterium 4572_55]|nr:MAG: hypothetical protein B6244_02705 [Candidatus Cloacimonetes bacterium 4572_55]